MHSISRAAATLLTVVVAAGCGAADTPRSPTSTADGSSSATAVTPTARPLPTSLPVGSPAVTPSPEPTSSPTQSPGSAQLPYDSAKFGFRAKGMTGEIMVFMPSSEIQYALDDMDWDVVSTVAYFGLEAGKDGRLRQDSGWKAWNSTRMDRLIEKAHATGTKVVISLKRFSWSPGQTALTRTLLDSAAARQRLATDVAAEVARRGVDGVNVDFEPIPVGRKAQFTDFIRKLRKELDGQRAGYQLTFAIVGHYESYDVGSAVGPDAADAVYLMGYHYSGTFSKIAGSNAPMGGPRYDVADTVKSLLKLVEPHEIIVGVPYYGHIWPTVSGNLNARTAGGGYDVQYHRAVDLGQRIGLRYDRVQQVAWGRFQQRACPSCPLRWYQMYFDDHRAVAHKWEWVKSQELLGGGVWTIGFEGGAGALTNVMREAFLKAEATTRQGE
jgi:chitinase